MCSLQSCQGEITRLLRKPRLVEYGPVLAGFLQLQVAQRSEGDLLPVSFLLLRQVCPASHRLHGKQLPGSHHPRCRDVLVLGCGEVSNGLGLAGASREATGIESATLVNILRKPSVLPFDALKGWRLTAASVPVLSQGRCRPRPAASVVGYGRAGRGPDSDERTLARARHSFSLLPHAEEKLTVPGWQLRGTSSGAFRIAASYSASAGDGN